MLAQRFGTCKSRDIIAAFALLVTSLRKPQILS